MILALVTSIGVLVASTRSSGEVPLLLQVLLVFGIVAGGVRMWSRRRSMREGATARAPRPSILPKLSRRTRGALWLASGLIGQVAAVPVLLMMALFGMDSPTANPALAWALGWVISGGPLWVLAAVRGILLLRGRDAA